MRYLLLFEDDQKIPVVFIVHGDLLPSSEPFCLLSNDIRKLYYFLIKSALELPQINHIKPGKHSVIPPTLYRSFSTFQRQLSILVERPFANRKCLLWNILNLLKCQHLISNNFQIFLEPRYTENRLDQILSKLNMYFIK